MKNFLKNKNKANILLGILLAVVFGQALIIGKLFTEKDQKNYEVNLVKINTEKDSIDSVSYTHLTLPAKRIV